MENMNGSGSVIVQKYGKILFAIGVLLAIFLAVLSIKELKSLAYIGRDVPAMNTISVSGKGEVFQAPDVATFTFTVRDENLIVSKAQETVNGSISDILAYLKKSGVAEKDIRTLGYNVYPRYEYKSIVCSPTYCPPSDGSRNLAGYEVSQMIEVKVRKLADAGKLVSGVGELGATEISGLNFTVDEEEGILREARQKAISDAQAKAKHLAKDLGVRLVRIVNYSEGGNYPIYYNKGMAYGMGGAVAESAPLAGEIPTGENQFISNVTITYEIR